MKQITKRTSYALPRLWAKGKVIKLGTKKTGSHFANSVAPGFNTLYTPSPHSSFNVFKRIMDAKRAPHPASDDGKGIEYFRNKDRNCMSRKMRAVVARTVCLVPGDEGAEAAAVAERAVLHFLKRAHDDVVLCVNEYDSGENVVAAAGCTGVCSPNPNRGGGKETRLATRAADRETFDKRASSSMVIMGLPNIHSHRRNNASLAGWR